MENNDGIDYCDICGRECEGVHSSSKKNDQIQRLVKLLERRGEIVCDAVIKQIYENRRLKNQTG